MQQADSIDQAPFISKATSTFPATVNWMLLDWCFALALVLLVPIVYFPYALYNLPVAGNVDERTSLAVLKHFHDGGLNPYFFMYPTLYYYVTYFITAAFSFSKILFYGRLLNLSFVGLTAAITYSFCRQHLGSRAVGVVAALCVVSSMTITSSGAYLCTDVLLAASTMASLYYLVGFFHHKRAREWLLAMLLLGCAVGCKYTAFLVFIAYCLTEIFLRIKNRCAEDETSGSSLAAKVPRTLLICSLLGFGLIGAATALAFPTQSALNFIAKTRTNADLRATSVYLAFFLHIRVLLAVVAIVCIIAAAIVARVRVIYEWVSLRRLYYGLGIVVFVSLLATPYSLITPTRFLYDLGALARANVIVASNHVQWRNYISWVVHGENPILLFLSGIGLTAIALKKKSQFVVVAVYLIVSAYVLGSAHVGYARYLTPLLPIVYCGAGSAIVWLWKRESSKGLIWTRLLTIIIVIIISIQLGARITAARAERRNTDACLKSYQVIASLSPESVLYAGEAPAVELELAGFPTRQVSWATLGQRPLNTQLRCHQLLVFDTLQANEKQVTFRHDATVSIILDDPRGHGQEVVKLMDCP